MNEIQVTSAFLYQIAGIKGGSIRSEGSNREALFMPNNIARNFERQKRSVSQISTDVVRIISCDGATQTIRDSLMSSEPISQDPGYHTVLITDIGNTDDFRNDTRRDLISDLHFEYYLFTKSVYCAINLFQKMPRREQIDDSQMQIS